MPKNIDKLSPFWTKDNKLAYKSRFSDFFGNRHFHCHYAISYGQSYSNLDFTTSSLSACIFKYTFINT